MRHIPGIILSLLLLLMLSACGEEQTEGELREEAQAVAESYLEVYASGRGVPPANIKSGPQRRLMAERAAKIQALLAALRQAGKSEDLLRKEAGKIETSGYIRSYEVLEKKLGSDDSVEVRLRVIVRK